MRKNDYELDKPMAPIKITCTSVDCERNLHCFLKKRGMPVEEIGSCRACGADLIDWQRVHKRNIRDQGFTFSSLKNELIRHHMWHLPFDDIALDKVHALGRTKLYPKILPRLRSAIGRPKGAFDGRQTPMQGNVIYYAQHATATCCRKCLNYWHNIPTDTYLTDDQLAYCEAMVTGYLDIRLSEIPERKPQLVRRQRKT